MSLDKLFEAAVAQGRELAAAIDANKWKLAALADGVGDDYGEAHLERFAERIDVLYGTIKRYRSVYRAWKDIDLGAAPPSYTVLSALAAVENRAELIRANPRMTAVQAREIARADSLAKAKEIAAKIASAVSARAASAADSVTSDTPAEVEDQTEAEDEPETEEDSDEADAEAEPEAEADSGTADEDDSEWEAGETRRWAGMARVDAVKAYQLYGESAQRHLVPARLMTVDDLFSLIDALTDGGAAMTSLAEKMSAIWVESHTTTERGF